MKRLACLFLGVVLVLGLFSAGCRSSQPMAGGTAIMDCPPLRKGESIRVEMERFEVGFRVCEIDADGFVTLGPFRIEVAGLSPDQAASKIRQTFVPWHYIELIVRVVRVQPFASGNAGLRTGVCPGPLTRVPEPKRWAV